MSERFSRRSRIIGLVLVVILLGIGGALVYFAYHPAPWIAQRVSWAINRTWGNSNGFHVQIDEISGTPLGEMCFSGVRFEHWEGAVRATIDTLRVDPALFSLLRGRIAFRSFVLVSPDLRMLGAGEEEAAGDPAASEGLPHLEVRQLVIRNGRMVGGPLGQAGSLDRVELEGFLRASGDHFALRIDRGSAALSPRVLKVESLTGWLTRKGPILRPKLTVETPRSSVVIKGEVGLDDTTPSQLRIGLGDLSLDEIAEFEPRTPEWLSGWISGALYVTGSPDSWDARVSLQGEVSDWPTGEVRASLGGAGERLALSDLAIQVEGARVTSDRVHANTETGQFEGHADVLDLDLSRFLEKAQAGTDLNARVDFSGTGLSGTPFSLSLGVDLSPSRFRQWTLDQGRVDLETEGDSLWVRQVAGAGPGWDLSGHGTWARRGDLQADVMLDVISLEPFGQRLGKNLGGAGEVHVRLGGTPEDLAGQASVDLTSLDFAGTRIDTLMANVSFSRGSKPLETSCFLEGRGFSRGWLSGQKLVANLRTVGRNVEEFQAIGQIDSVLLHVDGRMTDHDGARTFHLDRAEISSPRRLWHNEGPVELEISADVTRLRPTRWVCEGGLIETAAQIGPRGGMDITARAQQVSLGSLAEVAMLGGSPDGIVDLSVSVSGTLSEPRARLSFDVEPLALGAMEMDVLRGALDLDSSTLSVDSVIVAVAAGRGKVTGSLPVEFALAGERGRQFQVLGLGDMNLEILGLALEALGSGTSESPPVSGQLDLTAAFSGSREDPRGDIEARISGARFRSFELGQVGIRSAVRDRSLVIDEVDISSGASSGKITGVVPLEGRSTFPWIAAAPSGIAMDVRVNQGRFTFLPFVKSSVFKHSDGLYDLDLRISGSLAHPALRGAMRVSKGRLRIGPLAEEITEVEADVVFDEHLIHVERLKGKMGGGSLGATARVVLDSLRAVDYRVEVDAQRTAIASLVDDVSAVADVELWVRPDTTGFGNVVPRYSGRVEVHQAEITRGLTGSGNGGLPLAPTVAPTYLMELNIEAGNNVWVRNSDAEIELEGTILYKKNAQGTKFLGDLKTIRGRYFLYNNEFRITSGSLEFADVRDVRNARLEVRAETEVATDEGRERVDLQISGTLAKPYLAATSESGYSEPEIFRLLALGQEADAGDEGTASPFSKALARSWGTILARRFGSELARSLGLDELEIEPGPGDLGDREFVEGARVGVGKYLSDSLYLKYKQSLAVNPLRSSGSGAQGGAVSRTEGELPERQILLEYRLSRSFSLDGEASAVNGKTYYNLDVRFRHRY
jgi:hypothetical protein